VPSQVEFSMSSTRRFTIYDAAPLLFSLCLDKQFLTAPFHLFGEGLPSFLQFRIRLMVHEIMRATTDNFSVKAGIPSLPIAEHNKICDWIQVVMWHLVRSLVLEVLRPVRSQLFSAASRYPEFSCSP
jgi:hypothetical protein